MKNEEWRIKNEEWRVKNRLNAEWWGGRDETLACCGQGFRCRCRVGVGRESVSLGYLHLKYIREKYIKGKSTSKEKYIKGKAHQGKIHQGGNGEKVSRGKIYGRKERLYRKMWLRYSLCYLLSVKCSFSKDIWLICRSTASLSSKWQMKHREILPSMPWQFLLSLFW